MEAVLLKPKGRQKREARDLALYTDYQKLMSVEGQSKTEAGKLRIRKYNIDYQNTIRTILHHIENRLKGYPSKPGGVRRGRGRGYILRNW